MILFPLSLFYLGMSVDFIKKYELFIYSICLQYMLVHITQQHTNECGKKKIVDQRSVWFSSNFVCVYFARRLFISFNICEWSSLRPCNLFHKMYIECTHFFGFQLEFGSCILSPLCSWGFSVFRCCISFALLQCCLYILIVGSSQYIHGDIPFNWLIQ